MLYRPPQAPRPRGVDMDFNKLTHQEPGSRRRRPGAGAAAGNPELYARASAARPARPGAAADARRARGRDAGTLRAEAEARLAHQADASRAATQPQASAAFAPRARRRLRRDAQARRRVRLRRASAARARRGPARRAARCAEEVRGGQKVTSQDPEGSYQALEKFGRDLTALAEPASSIRSSAVTRRSGASSRCSRGGRRTTRC